MAVTEGQNPPASFPRTARAWRSRASASCTSRLVRERRVAPTRSASGREIGSTIAPVPPALVVRRVAAAGVNWSRRTRPAASGFSAVCNPGRPCSRRAAEREQRQDRRAEGMVCSLRRAVIRSAAPQSGPGARLSRPDKIQTPCPPCAETTTAAMIAPSETAVGQCLITRTSTRSGASQADAEDAPNQAQHHRLRQELLQNVRPLARPPPCAGRFRGSAPSPKPA